MTVAEYEIVETPAIRARTWAILAGLQASASHVFLRSAASQGVSLLVEADPDRQIVMFDALRGVPPPDRVGAPMRFESHVDGRRLEFGCYFQSVLQMSDGPVWVATEPRLLRDMERRNCFRLRIPTRSVLKASIADADGGALSSLLVDVSSAGFGATLQEPLTAEIGTIAQCSLELPGLRIDCQANLRHLESVGHGTRVGFQFIDMPRPLSSALGRTVVSLERELLRKYPKPAPRRRS